jgi:DNA-binding response OmpR family regulator
MALDPQSRARFNLAQTCIVLVDSTPLGMAILVQILTGFGAKNIHRCASLSEAKAVASQTEVDLFVIDGMADAGSGYDLVRWVRHDLPEPRNFTPILLTAGHTVTSDVSRARDCGAHFIVSKPISPIVLLERIIWMAREGRVFLHSDNYVGPDRRFSAEQRTPEEGGRRREDRFQEPDAPQSASWSDLAASSKAPQ